MSSLKDIMDVDVEPLESQAYRRKEAAQQQASHPSLDPSSQSPSPQLDDNKGKPSVNRRRSNRVSKSTTQTTTSRSTIPRRRSSAAAEAMDFSAFQLGGSNQGSISGSSLQTSSRGGMDQLGDVPVKYTPVTGRISRAKKGIPVHTCEDCKPAKTFTRAEHLRRHKLSHGKPAYPCTFEDCERTFHRSDLLARHLSRHETQGEKAYKASDPRSRASSSASESAPLKLEPAPHGVISTGLSQMSPNDSMTPRTTNTFQAVNFSPEGSQTRSAPHSTLTDAEVYPPSTGAASSTMPFNYNDIPSTSSSFPQLYPDGPAPFTGYNPQSSLPLLRIPEDPLMPDLPYTQDSSPWCSSASDSTYSTHSDSSHIGRLVPRGRSGSLVTAPEWPAVPVSGPHWSPHGMTTTPQDLRSPPYETVMEAYETPYTPPRMSPPTRQLLDVPLGNYFMESVGNPHPSTYHRHFAQTFSASSPRVSNTRLAVYDRRSKDLVANQQLGIVTSIDTVMAIPTQSAMANINQYLTAYWENFDKLYPFIHRATFTHDHDFLLLSFAMAAIGTQYCYNIEARKHGVELHAYCTKTIPLTLNWTLQTLQAILLTEIFTCFRGKRTTVRLSRQFEETYSRLLNAPYKMHEPESIADADPMNSINRTRNTEIDWLQWVDTESRHRLLCLCFIFDIHQAMYHQQSRAKQSSDTTNTIIYVPCPEVLWESTTAADWGANWNGNHSDQPLHLAQQYLLPGNSSDLSYFTQTLHICNSISQLLDLEDPDDPNKTQSRDVQRQLRRLENLFPTSPTLCTYLALYHTPLHDLLAVTGDTWLFSSKLRQPSLFREAQVRLRAWSSSPDAATAVYYACRVLVFALSEPPRTSAGQRNDFDHLELSHYWSLNVAVLICWAFGHRAGDNTIARFHDNPRPITDTDIDNPSHEASEKTRAKALLYARAMLGLDKAELLSNRAMIRVQSSYVIDAVRARLQFESIGDRCMMLVDCIGVLKRLREPGRGKLF